uniref:ANK_REP_REGION domain-containing protein n=1 Tax=Anopheles atroparvus TaxID=41427 RepID=A0A182J6Z4_ANOAO
MAGRNRFHTAATVGNLPILREATRWEANSVDANLLTPVLLAAASGQSVALTVLLKRGGDPAKTDRSGNSALHLAAAGGHRKCVECLLAAGCGVFEMNTAGRRALDVARLHRQFEVVEVLEGFEADLAGRDPGKCDEQRKRAAKQYEKLKLRYGAVISLNLGDSFRALEEHTALEEESA